jgi:Ca-activated chloride channel family protein
MTFTNPHFAEPQWLWLAALGPIALIALQRYAAWARRKSLAQLAAPQFVSSMIQSHSRARRALKEVSLVLATAAIGLALARPQWGEQSQKSQLFGQDIIFLVDCSRSMLATDVSPSRLQRAKLAILDFMQHQAHGRLGLVAFAGQAFLQCPLTFDYGAFHESLSALDEKIIPIPGTDVGRALQEGFEAMDKGDRQKLLILVTDGEDLEKTGVRTAESLAKKGVVVFTVGVGTPSGAQIQVLNERGMMVQLKDPRGEPVHSRLDETTLRAIAEATHGAYYRLGPVGEGLARVRLALENLKTSSGAAPSVKFGVDRFYLPLGFALALLVVETLLGTRKRRTGEALP